MAKVEVMPILEEKFKKDIDEMINIELENIKLLASSGKKKKGKKKKTNTNSGATSNRGFSLPKKIKKQNQDLSLTMSKDQSKLHK